MAVQQSESARREAIRSGWGVRPLSGPREFLFAKNGRVFTAAFPTRRLLPAESERQRELRAAGVSAYVVESRSEWAAVMDFENRHADL